MKKARVASLLAATLVCTSVFSGAKIPGSYAATKGQDLPEDAKDSEKLGAPIATGSDAGLQTVDLDDKEKLRSVSGAILPAEADWNISVVPIDSGGEEKWRFSDLEDSQVAVVIFGGAHCELTKGTLNNIKNLPDTYGDSVKFVFIDGNDYSSRSATADDLRALAKTIPGFDVCNDTLSNKMYPKYGEYWTVYGELTGTSSSSGSLPHVFMVKGGEIVYHNTKGGVLRESVFTEQLDKLLGRSEETEKPETVDFAARKKAIQDFYKQHPFDLKKSVTYDEEPVLKDNEHTAGKVSQDSIQNGLNALNFVRFVAGLSSVEIDENLQDYTQKGAVLMHSTKKMSHYPDKPDNMQKDFYDAAYIGTSKSNIAWGSMEPNLAYNVIEQWMEDGDPSNITRVGHRRWCLNPDMAYTGFGYSGGYSAMYSLDHSGTAGVDEGYIPWPAAVMPYEYFKGPWSVSLDREVLKLNADSVVVTLDYNGKQYKLSNTSKTNGEFYISEETGGSRLGCGSTIIFKPNVDFDANSVVDVTVAGVTDIEGNEKELHYTVRFFSMSDTSDDDSSDDNDNDNTNGDNTGDNDNDNTDGDNTGDNDNDNTDGDNDNDNTGGDNTGDNDNTSGDNTGDNDNDNTGDDNTGDNDNDNTDGDNTGDNDNDNTGGDNTGDNSGSNNDNSNGGNNNSSKPIPAITWRPKSKRPSNTKLNTQNQSSTNNQSSNSKKNVPSYVSVGAWTTGSNGTWKFTDESGMLYVNRWAAVYNPNAGEGKDNYGWFRFDEKGDMITGWLTDPVDGMTYYMNPISDGTMGQMMTGWVTIDGKEYYFNPQSDGFRGRMYRNETTPDGHFVDINGVKVR